MISSGEISSCSTVITMHHLQTFFSVAKVSEEYLPLAVLLYSLLTAFFCTENKPNVCLDQYDHQIQPV